MKAQGNARLCQRRLTRCYVHSRSELVQVSLIHRHAMFNIAKGPLVVVDAEGSRVWRARRVHCAPREIWFECRVDEPTIQLQCVVEAWVGDLVALAPDRRIDPGEAGYRNDPGEAPAISAASGSASLRPTMPVGSRPSRFSKPFPLIVQRCTWPSNHK